MPRMKRAYRGLYGNRMIQFGNKVSFAENKTRRTWKPNVHRLSLYSEAMGLRYRFRITSHALRTVHKHGGLDEYLLKTRDSEIKYPAALRLKQFVKVLRAAQLLPKDTAVPEQELQSDEQPLIVQRVARMNEPVETKVGLQQVL